MKKRALIVFKASVCVIKFGCECVYVIVCVCLLIEHVADVVIVCVWMCIWHAGPSLESRARILEAVGRRWLASEHGGPFVTDGWVLGMQSWNHPLTHMWVCTRLNTHTEEGMQKAHSCTAMYAAYACENMCRENLGSLSTYISLVMTRKKPNRNFVYLQKPSNTYARNNYTQRDRQINRHTAWQRDRCTDKH